GEAAARLAVVRRRAPRWENATGCIRQRRADLGAEDEPAEFRALLLAALDAGFQPGDLVAGEGELLLRLAGGGQCAFQEGGHVRIGGALGARRFLVHVLGGRRRAGRRFRTRLRLRLLVRLGAAPAALGHDVVELLAEVAGLALLVLVACEQSAADPLAQR